ncbi:outer membrane porin, OprD family [Thiovulum sp. ES]|nr:outer membrane porin, OprD family [Thiovulum sp. ES]
MKKVVLPFLLSAPLFSSEVANSFTEIFEKGKGSGEWRTFYVTRDRHGSYGDKQNDTSGLATGGHLKFETAPFYGLNLGFALYSTNALINPKTGDKNIDPSLYGDDKDGYSILGEAYLQYGSPTGNLYKFGRQKLNTPLAGSDDARMLPNLFEAYLFQTKHVPDSTLTLAHVTKFAAGSFSNIYWDLSGNVGANGITGKGFMVLSSGYGLNNDSGKFMNMGHYAVNQDTDGVSVFGLENKSIPNTTIKLWNYHAYDILNATYGQIDHSVKLGDDLSAFISGQMIMESSIGDEIAGTIDSQYYAGKVGLKSKRFVAYGAYSAVPTKNERKADGSIDNIGAIITPWGGIPAYTQGMVTRHQFFADTTAMKLAGTFKFKEDFDLPLSLTGYYIVFDTNDDDNFHQIGGGQHKTNWKTKEAGFDAIYKPSKNVMYRLRYNSPRDFVFVTSDNGTPDDKSDDKAETIHWDELRFIISYKF